MTRDEEYRLIELAKAGDVSAKEALYWQFRPMLLKFANKTYCKWLDKDDLFQSACVYFLETIQVFDFIHKVRLSTFIYQYVPPRLMREANTAGVVRISPVAFQCQPEKAKAAMNAGGYGSMYFEKQTHDLDLYDFSRMVTRLRAEIAKMPQRWQDIINRRLEGKTLAEVGQELGVSKQRVAQVEAKIHDRIVQSGIGRIVV